MARKSKDLTVIEGSQNLPVVPMVNFKSFSKFVRMADKLVEKYENICKAQARIKTGADPIPTERDFTLGEYTTEILAECRALWEEFNPEHYYDGEDEDWALREDLIGARLAYTLGSVKVTGGTPEAFSEMVLNHVADIEDLTWPALEGACRQVEAECKFLSISEIKEAINEHIELWDKRRDVIESLDTYAEWGLGKLKESRNKKLVEAAERAERGTRLTYEMANKEFYKARFQLCSMQARAAEMAEVIEMGMDRLTELEADVAQKFQAAEAATSAKYKLFMELDSANADEEDDA